MLAVRMWLPRNLVATYVFFKAEIVYNLSTNVRYISVITYILHISEVDLPCKREFVLGKDFHYYCTCLRCL